MNCRKYFTPELVASLTEQVAACAKEDEPNVYYTMDIFYNIEKAEFLVLLDQEHDLTEDDGDLILWDVQVRGTIEKVIDVILECFVEESDIPEGGYYCRPISWSPPPLKTLVVHDVQLLSPNRQGWLLASLSVRPIKVEVKTFRERTEYWVSFPPDQKEEVLTILNRFVKN